MDFGGRVFSGYDVRPLLTAVNTSSRIRASEGLWITAVD